MDGDSLSNHDDNDKKVTRSAYSTIQNRFFFARFVRAWLKFVRFAVVPVLINADRLAQLVGCRTTVRVVVGSNPGRTNIQVL